MAEIGLDISREFPKPLTSDQVRAADVVITMGCGDACPVLPRQALPRLGPARPRRPRPPAAVRPIRGEIAAAGDAPCSHELANLPTSSA